MWDLTTHIGSNLSSNEDSKLIDSNYGKLFQIKWIFRTVFLLFVVAISKITIKSFKFDGSFFKKYLQ